MKRFYHTNLCVSWEICFSLLNGIRETVTSQHIECHDLYLMMKWLPLWSLICSLSLPLLFRVKIFASVLLTVNLILCDHLRMLNVYTNMNSVNRWQDIKLTMKWNLSELCTGHLQLKVEKERKKRETITCRFMHRARDSMKRLTLTVVEKSNTLLMTFAFVLLAKYYWLCCLYSTRVLCTVRVKI